MTSRGLRSAGISEGHYRLIARGHPRDHVPEPDHQNPVVDSHTPQANYECTQRLSEPGVLPVCPHSSLPIPSRSEVPEESVSLSRVGLWALQPAGVHGELADQPLELRRHGRQLCRGLLRIDRPLRGGYLRGFFCGDR
jgi:hypothetical protein